ncbi:MAG: winged helix-turn-helix transcriptional regulator, partial [Promethearchaeota archaeon]
MKEKKENKFKIDDINFYILKTLSKSGRISYSQMARDLGLTHVSIKNRYEDMENKNVIRSTIEINYNKLGLKLGLILLEIETQNFDNLLKIYKTCPRVIFHFPLMGQYNYAILFYGENESTFQTILDSCILYCLKGIRKSNLLIIGKINYPLFLRFNFNLINSENEKAPCGIICKECNKFTNNLCLG